MKKPSVPNEILFLARWVVMIATDSIEKRWPELREKLALAIRGDERRVGNAVRALFEGDGPLRKRLNDHSRAMLNAANILAADAVTAAELKELVSGALVELYELTARPWPSLPWAARLTNSIWEPRISRARYAATIDDTRTLLRELSPHDEDPAEIDRDFGRVIGAIRMILEGSFTVAPGNSRPSTGKESPKKTKLVDYAGQWQGRQSRADLVMAILHAKKVILKTNERGMKDPTIFTANRSQRYELIDTLLRDGNWDNIDQTTGREGVVEGILEDHDQSPLISLHSVGGWFIHRIDP